MAWLYVPAVEASTSQCKSPSPDIELWVTLSGKPVQRPLSWRGWKTRRWIKRLYGTISEPSTANRGADSWISSLRATRANQTQLPANARAKTMTGGSLIRSSELSRKCGLLLSSEKTSRGTLTDNSRHLFHHWKDWGTALRLEYSRRLKPAPVTNENAFSSWPTATTQDATQRSYQYSRGDKTKPIPTLAGKARTWPTPRASENENRTTKPAPSHGKTHGRLLAGEAVSWQTPSVADTTGGHMNRSGKRSNELLLKGQAMTFPVSAWPTPAARDYKGANSEDHLDAGTGRKHMDQLPNFVAHSSHCLRPAPETSTHGGKSSPSTRYLNPRFVELLMNWPIGMTDYDFAVTGFSHWKARMRSELSRLCLASIEEPQLSMFN